jgi:hypothetical protein
MPDAERIPLPGPAHGWVLWREFVLRSSGFPFAALTDAVSEETSDEEAGFDWAGSVAAGMRRALALAATDGVRSALLWQNPQILGQTADWLTSPAGAATGRNSRRRASEHAVMKYLQRYHTKNESVGFFGPVVWGAFDGRDERVAVKPGVAVRGRQCVYFEDWAIEALGRAFAADPEIAPQLPPAPVFGVTRLGRALVRPDGSLLRLTAQQQAVLALVDGRRRADEIADALGTGVDEVDGVLLPFADEGLITRRFEVPPDLDSEKTLARALRELAPGPAVAEALAALDRLDAARRATAEASDAAALAHALEKLDGTFAEVSGAAGTRSRDEAKAGRRLVAMQAERDVSIAFGARLVEELGPPLGLVLAAARWFARRAGEELELIAEQVHAQLAPMYANAAVPLNALISRLVSITQPGRWLDELVADLERRWVSVLEPDFAASRIERDAAGLAEAVRREFGGPAPGYAAGRHQSPDVMLAASGPEAIEAGEYTAVLGELHVGMVTADCGFPEFASDPECVRGWSDAALVDGQPRFVPLHVRGVEASISGWDHPAPNTYCPATTYLSFGERLGERAVPHGKVPAGAVTVARHGDRLAADLPDGSRHPLLHVLGDYAVYALVSRFRLLPARPHTPRVTVDRLVVARETWRLPFDLLRPLTRLSESEAYTELLRLAREQGIARHTYWRPVRAVKPVYLDLHSPLLAAMLVRELRRAANVDSETITFSEMHPGPGELWLPDAEGRRYTSELRLTLADTTAPEGVA